MILEVLINEFLYSHGIFSSTPLPDVFSDDEVKQMTEYMRMAIEEAKKGLQEGKVSG